MDYCRPFFFFKDEVFLLVLSLSFFTPSKVGLKNPFATLPLPFSLILLSFFLKSDITFLNERVPASIFSLYTVP